MILVLCLFGVYLVIICNFLDPGLAIEPRNLVELDVIVFLVHNAQVLIPKCLLLAEFEFLLLLGIFPVDLDKSLLVFSIQPTFVFVMCLLFFLHPPVHLLLFGLKLGFFLGVGLKAYIMGLTRSLFVGHGRCNTLRTVCHMVGAARTQSRSRILRVATSSTVIVHLYLHGRYAPCRHTPKYHTSARCSSTDRFLVLSFW
jgi:hypothetical protein